MIFILSSFTPLMDNNLKVKIANNSCKFSISELHYKMGAVNNNSIAYSVIPINKIFRFVNNELMIPSMDAYMLIRLKICPVELYNEPKNPIVVFGQVPLYKIKGKHSANSTLKETQICVVMLKDYLDKVVFEGGLYFEFQNMGLQEEVSNLVIFINSGNVALPSFYSCHSFKLEYSVHQMDKYDPFKVLYYEISHTNTPASPAPPMPEWEKMNFVEKIFCVIFFCIFGVICLKILVTILSSFP